MSDSLKPETIMVGKYEVNKCGIVLNPEKFVLVDYGYICNVIIDYAEKDNKVFVALHMSAHDKGTGSGVSFNDEFYESVEQFLKEKKEYIIEYFSESPQDSKALSEIKSYYRRLELTERQPSLF